MKKRLLALAIILANGFYGHSQTTATDFTANDCNGISHHLFAELDAGNIIVVSFVMPCGLCVGPTLSANNVANSYSTTHPGRVFFYVSDDAANTACTTLSSWEVSNGLFRPTTFSDISFKESDYGIMGMPKIVVLAGQDHRIIYTQNNSLDTGAIKSAIDAQLATTAVSPVSKTATELTAYPNPAKNYINLNCNLSSKSNISINIFNLSGSLVKSIDEQELSAGANTIKIDFDGQLNDGMYFLEFVTESEKKVVRFTIAK